ncbi:MAG: hypothetical protein FWF33_00555 [Clostridiales bacterium]|nr:hypothetical protein [Clostridiales bacterium]
MNMAKEYLRSVKMIAHELEALQRAIGEANGNLDCRKSPSDYDAGSCYIEHADLQEEHTIGRVKNPRRYPEADPTAEAGALLADMNAALTGTISRITEEIGIVEAMIRGLTPTERTIIRERYIEGRSWQDTADSAYVSKRSCLRIHESALNKINTSFPATLRDLIEKRKREEKRTE